MMTESNESQHVCVIGIGMMGSALAEALLAKRHRVTVWNRTASKCDALAAAGASVAASASEAAAAAQVVVVSITDHHASASVVQTDDVARSLHGKLLMQFSTVTAEESRDMGRWAEKNGIVYLDGSILGYPQDIRGNNCTIVYSGPKAAFDANKNLLAAMGGNPQLVGEAIGGAPTFDKAVYSSHYGSLLAFFHGAAICHAAGFPIEIYVEEALMGGEGTTRRYGKMIADRSYEVTGGTLETDAAAYAHVVKLSEELGIDAAFPKMVASYFERAIAAGHGQQELPAMFEMLIKRSA